MKTSAIVTEEVEVAMDLTLAAKCGEEPHRAERILYFLEMGVNNLLSKKSNASVYFLQRGVNNPREDYEEAIN